MFIDYEVEKIKQDQTLSTSEKLNKIAGAYSEYNYVVVSRTENQIQMLRKKTFSFFWAIVWLLLGGFGILIYIFYYISKSDSVITITLPEQQVNGISTEEPYKKTSLKTDNLEYLKKITSKESFQKDKLNYLKDKIGTRQQYHDLIHSYSFDTDEKNILLQATAQINRSDPDMTLIKQAYTILSEKLQSQTRKDFQESTNISQTTNMHFSVADEILKLKSLMDNGIISEEDFLLQKNKLLNKNNNT